eukprot:s4912_g2.t1
MFAVIGLRRLKEAAADHVRHVRTDSLPRSRVHDAWRDLRDMPDMLYKSADVHSWCQLPVESFTTPVSHEFARAGDDIVRVLGKSWSGLLRGRIRQEQELLIPAVRDSVSWASSCTVYVDADT